MRATSETSVLFRHPRIRYAGGRCARTVISIKLDGGAGGLAVSEWSEVKRMLERMDMSLSRMSDEREPFWRWFFE